MKQVCGVLSVARSNVAARLARPADWQDGRSARKTDDAGLVEEIRLTVADLPSYARHDRLRTTLNRRSSSRHRNGYFHGATAIHAAELAGEYSAFADIQVTALVRRLQGAFRTFAPRKRCAPPSAARPP